tara:strand:- start:1345 stop:2277 length:933 start_codon:yes stop_codon:yes gene_type:complete
MFVITFDNKCLLGGLGDRIVGLISVKLMSKLLDKQFYILWNKEDIKPYINYEKYDYELLNINKTDIKEYNYIDNQTGLKHYLMNQTCLFQNRINMFRLNQEIAQYLYKNKLFEKENYFNDIISEYQQLYTNILVPTSYVKDKIDQLINNKNNIVGIQIRCGDYFISNNVGHSGTTKPYQDSKKYRENMDSYLLNIKKNCDQTYKDNYNIFFTTDNVKLLDNIIKIFNKSKVIYEDSLIQHLDRNFINSDISKIFIDSYILSQKTKSMFISSYSNFGRQAALSSTHNNIYDLDCNLLDKKNLLSKHEIIFN